MLPTHKKPTKEERVQTEKKHNEIIRVYSEEIPAMRKEDGCICSRVECMKCCDADSGKCEFDNKTISRRKNHYKHKLYHIKTGLIKKSRTSKD